MSNKMFTEQLARIEKENLNKKHLIPKSSFEQAQLFVDVFSKEFANLPAPFPSPCEDGTLHVSYTKINGYRLSFEFDDDKMYYEVRYIDNVFKTGSLLSIKDAIPLFMNFINDTKF